MRYSATHKAATRKRVLEASGALVKREGFASTGVDQLMGAAGLTGGAFYSHFDSKQALLREVIERELQRSRELLLPDGQGGDGAWLARMLDCYLTMGHVRHPETGCPLPSLGAEIARADAPTRQACEDGMVAMQRELAIRLGSGEAAWGVISQCVGALMLARTVANQDVAREILAGARAMLERAGGLAGDLGV
ncbi:TetR/AcrR family transcriptional regulator [Cupriavidus sp. CV2]|uniref:TetR/AcrR family transcriptional regulator n=1 Tax=Cupriavidus ulmosensis TaxID=3065913 RepID=UPI00296AFC91|nr:TetR/AcrR family transcriptional regulator [Cupriavidus sp. CV2]MDW3682660.1 TetR/AcrR family transcriptional regulator [Cupriavidus sp. CV2]